MTEAAAPRPPVEVGDGGAEDVDAVADVLAAAFARDPVMATFFGPAPVGPTAARGPRAAGGHGVQEHGVQEHGVQEHGVQEHGVQEHGVQEHGVQEHGVQEHGGHEHDRRARFYRAVVRSGALRHGVVDVARSPGDGRVLGAALWEAPGGSRRDRLGHLLAQVAHAPGFVGSLGARGTVRALRGQALLDRHRPRTPHWYLAAVGVTDGARGRGVGSALLRTRLAALDAAGAAAYLEASTDRSRPLYEAHGFVVLGTVAGLGGDARPWSMWRPAAGTQER